MKKKKHAYTLKEKLLPQTVLDAIIDHQPVTISELCKIFSSSKRFGKVTASVIKHRIKQLRESNESLICGQEGYSVLDQIESEDDFNGFRNYSNWLIGTARAAVLPFPQLKKTLKKSMPFIRDTYSIAEVQEAKSRHLLFARVYEAIEIEKELG